MSRHLYYYTSKAANLVDLESGLSMWMFATDLMGTMLCVEGEVSVFLTMEDQQIVRIPEEWKMLLISRGMLSPAADMLADWLAGVQQARQYALEVAEKEEVVDISMSAFPPTETKQKPQ